MNDDSLRVTVLSGGVGGSRFISGLLDAGDAQITVVANTADDLWLFGLRVSPDLDTVMYTLGGGIDAERGWGRTDETWNTKDELAAYGLEQSWFGLGDRDLATHLLRTMRLRGGGTLSEATHELCQRWQPGVRLLPMSDDEVETHITVQDGDVETTMHFQEFWIRHRAEPPVRRVEFRGIEAAQPAPGVIDAIIKADVVIVPPSNPIVSIGPIAAVAGIREAIARTDAPVVGVSPIIGGGAVRGMADQLLRGLGIDIGAASVALHHGPRSRGGLLDGWLVDDSDAGEVAPVEEAGIMCRAVPLYMSDARRTRRLAQDTLELAAELRRTR